jgi:hypothetical protein
MCEGVEMSKIKGTKAHTRYYTLDKQLCPGVTTVLGLLAKPALIKWANNLGLQGIDSSKYVDAAAQIGTCAHLLVQSHLAKETPDLSQFSPDTISQAENSLISFFEWEKAHKIKPVLLEKSLVSERYRYGGSLDIYAEIDGQMWLCDIKTGKGIYDEMACQLAAYRQLLMEHDYQVHGCRIIRIGRDATEGFEDRVYAGSFLDKQWEIFKRLLEIHWLKKEA